MEGRFYLSRCYPADETAAPESVCECATCRYPSIVAGRWDGTAVSLCGGYLLDTPTQPPRHAVLRPLSSPPLCGPQCELAHVAAPTPDFDTTGAFPVTTRTPPGLAGTECSVCADALVSIMLLDCYHLVLCHACACKLSHGAPAQARCPLCRAPIVRAVPCFAGAPAVDAVASQSA